jgi:subtilisin family serine protease
MVSAKSLLTAGVAALALGAEAATPHRNAVKGAYVVEFHDDADTSAFYTHIEGSALTRRNLTYSLFKGASIQFNDATFSASSAKSVAKLPGVKNVFPVRRYGIPKPRVQWTANIGASYDHRRRKRASKKDDDEEADYDDVFSTHVMTGVDRLHKEGLDGKGVKVAVIDTGIDYSHPALGGCYGKGCLVSFGSDLVGDDYDGFNEPKPSDDPMDCNGHGTHVAGTIAAQFDENPFGIVGAAPGVELGAYRVIGCDGSVQNDVLIAAYHEAYEAGADVITASIGGPAGWAEEEWSAAVSKIVDKGIPCLLAAGNEGEEGLWYASAAADGKNVAAVASVNNVVIPTLLRMTSYTVDDDTEVGFGWVPGEPAAWDDSALPVYATSLDPTVEDDACAELPEDTPDLADNIVLIRRGGCDFDTKATNAAAFGARYVLFYNNAPGASDTYSTDENILAVAMTTAEAGEQIVAALNDGSDVVVTMADPLTAELSLINVPAGDALDAGGAMSSFTTWGPTYEGDAKPTFASVGGKILSTWPVALGSYAQISGTSMATPLAAGVYALLIQKRGTSDPLVLQNLLAATAHPVEWHNGTDLFDALAPVPQQGAGLIDAYAAAHASVMLSTTGIAWNDTDNFEPEQRFTIQNLGKKDVTFVLDSVAAVTAFTFLSDEFAVADFPMEISTDAATLTFDRANVTVKAGGKATVRVTAEPPADVDEALLPVWSGFIVLNSTDGGCSYSLPYQGISGSLYSQQIISTDDEGVYVGAGSADDEDVPAPAEADAEFLLPPKDADEDAVGNYTLPTLVADLLFGSRYVEANIVPVKAAAKDKKTKSARFARRAEEEDEEEDDEPMIGAVGIGMPDGHDPLFKPRGALIVSWDGLLAGTSKYAPAGSYKFVVRALKIFGDEESEDDWEEAETGVFSISYDK